MISSSSSTLTMLRFSSSLIDSSIRTKSAGNISRISKLKISLKYLMKVEIISLGYAVHSPLWVQMADILFFRLLFRVDAWKNLVFLSPSLIKEIHDLCL